MAKYVKQQLRNQCVLAHCAEYMIHALQLAGIDCIHIRDPVNHLFLQKKLDKTDSQGRYPCLVVTDSSVGMRGLNYRSSEAGVLLLVLRSFQHQREANQAAYRVGRNGDACKRQVPEWLMVVDGQAEEKYKASLHAFMREQAPTAP